MRIAVCEDNAIDRATICRYIKHYCEANRFCCEIYEFESGEAFLESFSRGGFDVVFLDIFMGGITGMEVAQRIRKMDSVCSLVFITTSEDFMRASFAVQVTSYVVKPIKQEDMAAAFAACYDVFLKSARYIDIKSGYQQLRIPLVRVHYVGIENRAALFYTDLGVIKTYIPIGEVEAMLGGSPFLRCHQAFIVNMNYIVDTENYDFIMQGGNRVPMRKNGRKELRIAVSRFLSDKLFEKGAMA